MSKLFSVVDAYVEAARQLYERPSVEAAIRFWLAERRINKTAANFTWGVMRALLVERFGEAVITIVSRANELRARYLAMPPVDPDAPAAAGSSAESGRRDGRLPVHPR